MSESTQLYAYVAALYNTFLKGDICINFINCHKKIYLKNVCLLISALMVCIVINQIICENLPLNKPLDIANSM